MFVCIQSLVSFPIHGASVIEMRFVNLTLSALSNLMKINIAIFPRKTNERIVINKKESFVIADECIAIRKVQIVQRV